MLIATAKTPYGRDASKSREASISRDTSNSSNSRKSIPAAKKKRTLATLGSTTAAEVTYRC